jgi:hypothetical protein
MNFRAVSITTRVRVSTLRVGYHNKLNQGGVQMIYEFRTYEATPGNLPALNKHLEVAAGLFKKHGLGVMGFWTEEVGTGGQVNYMWVYEDLEERQKKLASFGSDPDWRKQVAEETAWAGFRSRRLVEAAALLLLVLVLALGVLVLRLLVVMGRVFSFKV